MKLIHTVITTVVLPGLTALLDYLGIDIKKVFEDVSTIVGDFAEKTMTKIKTVWEADVKPALLSLWTALTGKVEPAVEGAQEKFKGMTDSFEAGSAQMSEGAKKLDGDMTSAFDHIAKWITDELKPPFMDIVDFVWPLVVETWEEHLKPTFEAVVGYIRDEILPWLTENEIKWTDVWNAIKFVVTTVIGGIVLKIETGIGIVTAVIRGIIALMKGDWGAAWQAALDVVEEILEYITGVFGLFGVDIKKIMIDVVNGVIGSLEVMPNAFIGGLNAIIRAWNGFSLTIPGFSKKILGKEIGFKGFTLDTPNIPTIPSISLPRLATGAVLAEGHLAEGGIVTRPMLAEIGEREPEAVIPLSKLGGMGGGNKTYVIQLDGEKLGEFIINRVNQGSRNGELDLVGA